ncbi:MAG: hypothetical protein M1819_001774 [Sarea resinae]|nr:MAG: hypothetical protein M1819_001774 [Sarea resinae]
MSTGPGRKASISAHHDVVHHEDVEIDPPAADLSLKNVGAPGISYFTPAQAIPSGTASNPQPDGTTPPKLFTPLNIRGLTMQNRIGVPPMCQYSAQDGHATPFHIAHYGGIIQRGPGITIVEATSVLPEGRLTPEDLGLWKDSQVDAFKPVVEFAHSQNQKIAVQLGHAGRKACTVAPWLSYGEVCPKALGGWPDNVYAPSAIAFNDHHAQPKEMTEADIETFKSAWVAAVKRALAAGFDAIEIHNAHGYLLHSFLSPVSNHRTDKYGGSFENRIRLTVEIIDLTRANVPADFPIFLRISATDWLEHLKDTPSWTVEDSIKLAVIAAEHGVDLLDVSSGGSHPDQQILSAASYQADFAKKIKAVVGDKLLVATVGLIVYGKQAQKLLDAGLDVVLSGRSFLKNPGLVWVWAEDLGCEIQCANQIQWGFGGKVGFKKFVLETDD